LFQPKRKTRRCTPSGLKNKQRVCCYIFFFFFVLVIGFAMLSLAPLAFGAVESEPDFAAALHWYRSRLFEPWRRQWIELVLE
jgi:hypothetical protein